MNVILLTLIVSIIVILIFILLKSLNTNILITILCSIFIVQIVIRPKLCISSALLGVNLFVNKVFPSLFPFLIITSIMMAYDGISIYSRIFGNILCRPLRLPIQCTFAIIVSLLCGYPLGAKYACDLFEDGQIDFITCERLVNIASNASPLFIIGSVGTAMLGNTYLGYILLLSNYLSCFVMGLLIPAKSSYYLFNKQSNSANQNTNIGNIVRESIEGSIKTCLNIGGFVILFSVLISIIKSNILFDIAVNNISILLSVKKNVIEGILLGIIEMTNGAYLISNAATSMYIKLILISFILGFSGFSIISQVFSFTNKHNLSMKKYIIRKIFQGFICSVITILLYSCFIANKAIKTFSEVKINENNLHLLFYSTIILLLIPFIIKRINTLFHVS